MLNSEIVEDRERTHLILSSATSETRLIPIGFRL
jgi:hypothetical protein